MPRRQPPPPMLAPVREAVEALVGRFGYASVFSALADSARDWGRDPCAPSDGKSEIAICVAFSLDNLVTPAEEMVD